MVLVAKWLAISITHNLNYYLSIGNSLARSTGVLLLKLQMHKHENSIYFMHDQYPVT